VDLLPLIMRSVPSEPADRDAPLAAGHRPDPQPSLRILLPGTHPSRHNTPPFRTRNKPGGH